VRGALRAQGALKKKKNKTTHLPAFCFGDFWRFLEIFGKYETNTMSFFRICFAFAFGCSSAW
jgi:hypothetical protein